MVLILLLVIFVLLILIFLSGVAVAQIIRHRSKSQDRSGLGSNINYASHKTD